VFFFIDYYWASMSAVLDVVVVWGAEGGASTKGGTGFVTGFGCSKSGNGGNRPAGSTG